MSCTCVALLATAAHAWEASIGADALHAMSFTAEPKGGDVTTVDCISISDGIDDYWCRTTCSQGKCPENASRFALAGGMLGIVIPIVMHKQDKNPRSHGDHYQSPRCGLDANIFANDMMEINRLHLSVCLLPS